jgi:hypothetical protein
MAPDPGSGSATLEMRCNKQLFEKIDTVPVWQHVGLTLAAHEAALGFRNLGFHVDLGTSLQKEKGMIKRFFYQSTR